MTNIRAASWNSAGTFRLLEACNSVDPNQGFVFASTVVIGGADPVAVVTRSARSSNAKIKRELGWAPRFASSAQGVPDAVAALGRTPG